MKCRLPPPPAKRNLKSFTSSPFTRKLDSFRPAAVRSYVLGFWFNAWFFDVSRLRRFCARRFLALAPSRGVHVLDGQRNHHLPPKLLPLCTFGSVLRTPR